MRFRITFNTERGALRLPIHYNHLIQGAIYANLDRVTADFFHDRGFEFGKRRFKLFTFSRLMGEYHLDKESGEIVFIGGVRLIVSSPSHEFCSSLINCILGDGHIRLGSQQVEVVGIEAFEPTPTSDQVTLRVLSPVVTYSTMTRADGRKYTCYFQPGEQDFQSQVFENLKKKYEIIYGQPAPVAPMQLRPLGQPRMNLVMYENTVIKGYTCRLALSCPKELIKVGLDAGLGAKNSQGFGCVEMEEVVAC
ncbi:MAG TPA: CRISPR-associated endoribonuclease Cas6 [Firmicutes bacterium]|nr:CRISPR-associated endoribonuclease Cas6 [Bacillota bacterium]